jgi:hypothetical protein
MVTYETTSWRERSGTKIPSIIFLGKHMAHHSAGYPEIDILRLQRRAITFGTLE